MKKFITTIFAFSLFLPLVVEAGVSPEGNPNRPRSHFPEGRPKKKKKCKSSGGVTVCRLPRKPKKCSLKRPCIPPGYYRPMPPKVIPMRRFSY